MADAPALLSYALDTNPDPVQVSPSGQNTTPVTLTLVVNCPRSLASIAVRQILVIIPTDPSDGPANAGNLAASPPAADAASIKSSGPDIWKPEAGIAPGTFIFAPESGKPVTLARESLTITIKDIPASTLVGTAVVKINEWAATGGVAPPEPPNAFSGTIGIDVAKFPVGFKLGVFQATPANIDPGADPTCSTQLSWNGSPGATYTIQYNDVTIEHPAGQPDQPLPPVGSYKVSNLQDDITVFTLVVTVPGSVATQQQTTVNVNRAKIEKFVAFPPTLGQNGTCTLTWVTNADKCYIGDAEVQAPSGSQDVKVFDNSTYTLTAFRGKDMTQQPRLVTIVKPVLKSFQATVGGQPVSGPIDSGTVVTLSWDTQYADTVTIDQGIGQVAPSNTGYDVTVKNSTTFVLTVTGKGSPLTQSIPIKVNPVQITAFAVDPQTVDVGADVTLTWAAVRATAASISPGPGVVSPANGGSVVAKLNPQSDTTFTLTCEGPDGPVTSQVLLKVNSSRVTSINLKLAYDQDDNFHVKGTVSWTTEHASKVTLSCNNPAILGIYMDVGVNASWDFDVHNVGAFDPITFTVTASGTGAPNSASMSN